MFSSLALKTSPFFLLAFVLSGFFSTLRAGGVGTTTADILKINQGTRPAAMGGVYTAMGDDVYSVNYNPAGLASIKASQLVVLHLDSLAELSYEYLTFATAWGSSNVLAVNVTYRHSPGIDNQPGILPVANSDDLLGSVSYATKLADNIKAGATVKYLQSTLASFSASAVALDLGVQVNKLPFGIQAGLSVLNVGTGMTFNPASTADPLPMFIRFGIGTHQVIDDTKDLNIAAEVFKPSDQDIKLGFGAEFWLFPELFAVRGGYKFEGIGTPTGNVFHNYTLGCTLTRRIEGDDFSIDIAYNPADFTSTVQDTFFFALNFKFNQLRLF
jgi:hypothetical protein